MSSLLRRCDSESCHKGSVFTLSGNIFSLAGWLQLMGKEWCERPPPSHGKMGILQRSELTGKMSSSEMHTSRWHLTCLGYPFSVCLCRNLFCQAWQMVPGNMNHQTYIKIMLFMLPQANNSSCPSHGHNIHWDISMNALVPFPLKPCFRDQLCWT